MGQRAHNIAIALGINNNNVAAFLFTSALGPLN